MIIGVLVVEVQQIFLKVSEILVSRNDGCTGSTGGVDGVERRELSFFCQQHISATAMAAEAMPGVNITFRFERYSPFVIVPAVSTAHHAVLVNFGVGDGNSSGFQSTGG